tara:strand:+ start:4941 stop:5429 length:489 start_codon:yes stop_codon:yes gene_type:complete
MANTNTDAIALIEASPAGFATRKDVASQPLVSKGTASWTGTTALDTLRLCKIPVNATLDSIVVQCDDLGGATTTWDLGLYSGDTFAVVDLDCLATAVDGATALARTELRFEVKDHSTINQRMWEIAGLSTEPDYGDFYLVATVKVAATPIAGDVSFYATYSQ